MLSFGITIEEDPLSDSGLHLIKAMATYTAYVNADTFICH